MQSATLAETNKVNSRRVIEEIYNQGKLAVADELYAKDATRHDPATPDVGKGPDFAKQVAARYRAAFPDLHISIEEIFSDGEKVALRWRSTGTHRGELQGIAPTGKTFSATGISIIRFANGKIVEEWANWDTLGMLRQLGALPQ